MAFEPKKFNDIYEDMRGRITPVLSDFEVGSVARTMFESFAYELGAMYQKMQLVYLSGFVDTAEGSHLDNVVAVLGIQRSLPDFAVGKVIFTRDKGNLDLSIPVGTLVATVETNQKPKKVYKTIDSADLPKGVQTVEVSVQALERGQEMDADIESIVVMPRPISGIKSVNNPEPVKLVGRRRETDDELRHRAKNALLSSGKANTAALENALLALSGVLDVKIIEHFAETLPKYGMIDVVVDAPFYADIRDAVRKTVDDTRAAGIYANVKETEKIDLEGVVRIEPAQKNLTPEEHATLEHKARLSIADLLRSLKMGQPLLVSKMMKAVLAVEGVDDLSKMEIVGKKVGAPPMLFVENKMEAKPIERFTAGDNGISLAFASEDKDLPINITFKAAGLDAAKMQNLETAIRAKLPIKLGSPIDAANIKTAFAETVGIILSPSSTDFKLQPVSWRYGQQTLANYQPSFVEKQTLGKLFGYSTAINIEGAVLLTFVDGTSNSDKTLIKARVLSRMAAFLDALLPEVDVLIADLIADAQKEKGVLEVKFDKKDWVVNAVSLDKDKVDINPFEKAFLGSQFLVATDITNVDISELAINIAIGDHQDYPTTGEPKKTKDTFVKEQLLIAFNAFITKFGVGQNIEWDELNTAMKAADIGYNFTFPKLDVSTMATVDRRVQIIGRQPAAQSIGVRISEKARKSANFKSIITITVDKQDVIITR